MPRELRIDRYSFGTIRIDGATYDRDVVIEHGAVRRRRKKPSKRFRDAYGHTPLSLLEEIPWDCSRLVIGTGAFGALPVMREVEDEARKRGVEIVAVPTKEAIPLLRGGDHATSAILHLTC